ASPLLLHEVNTGPSIEIEPLTLEVHQNSSPKSSSGDQNEGHYLICKADNALSVHVRCSSSHPPVDSKPDKNSDPSRNKSDGNVGKSVVHTSTLTNNQQQPSVGQANTVNAFKALPVASKGMIDIVDPMTGVRHIEIKAAMTEEVLHSFHLAVKKTTAILYCVCLTLSSKGFNRSRVATVKFIPNAEKKSNITQRLVVPLGEKILLECPLGSDGRSHENRAVFWLWNDAEIMLNENVEVDAEKGSLLILRVGRANEGSYTCGVRGSGSEKNQASARRGETVYIDVRTDGAWSSWGSWSECTAKCGRGYRTRTRSCTNPPPRHGGKDCPGDYMHRTDCHGSRKNCSSEKDKADPHSSPQWSPWSDWSICGQDCRQHRQRWCRGSNKVQFLHQKQGQHQSNNPITVTPGESSDFAQRLPSGDLCPGIDHMSTNCTGGKCSIDFSSLRPLLSGVDNLVNNNHNYIQDQTPSPSHEQGFVVSNLGSVQAVAMVIGMALAAIILAFTFLIALRFWPRDVTGPGDKRQPPLPLHMAYTAVPVSGLSTLPTDVSASMDRDTRLQEFLTERKLDSGITVPLLQQMYTAPNKCAMPLTPSQTRTNFLNRSRTPSSTGKTHRSDSGSYQSGQPCSDYGAPGSCSEYDLIYDTIPDDITEPGNSIGTRSGRDQSFGGSLPCSKSMKDRQIAWLTVGPEGGRIGLERSGVWMTVPPDTLQHGRREMYVAVLDDAELKLSTILGKGQSVLSPIVQCGPADVALARPVVISFDLCAHPTTEKWNIHLLNANEETDSHDQPIWRKKVLDLPEENNDVLCYRDGRICYIQTDQLGRFVLCGESKVGMYAVKSIALLAFLSKRKGLSQAERTLKIYCVEDTKAAVETILLSEQEDSTLVESPKSVALHDGGANLCFSLEELSLPQGWSVKSSSLQEVPFFRVWSLSCGAHCSFLLLNSPQSTSFSARESPLECKITVYQRGSQSHRQVLNVSSSSACLVYRNLGLQRVESVAMCGGARGSPVVQQPVRVTNLTAEARNRLCSMLDAPTHDGPGDWTKLALRLGLERNLDYFASKSSPTACLLDLWEARQRNEDTALSLRTLLRHIDRHDAVTAVEKLLGAWV
ncbi:hypothetical protein BIW11_05167, partial [Tropilaelaps mercedesae]